MTKRPPPEPDPTGGTPVRRWRATVAYDGTDFTGWQSQRTDDAVQDHLERRLAAIAGTAVRIHGAGRTDAGVHALGQVCHFDLAWAHPAAHLLRALRSGLPAGISVRTVRPAPADFHARYSATGKRYRYQLYQGYASPLEARYTWSLGERPLDIEAMRAAASHLVGKHDFSAFAANRRDASRENPVKELRRLDLRARGRRLVLTTEGSGYLYKMVRSLVGCLVDVGRGKLTPADVARILASRERTALVVTAPPEGLCLVKVFY